MQHYIYQIEKSHVRTKNSVKATQFPFGHMGTKVYHILWPFKIVLCHVLANSFPQQTPTYTIISLESCSWPHNGCKSNIHSSFFCVHHLLRELSRFYTISRNAQQHLPRITSILWPPSPNWPPPVSEGVFAHNLVPSRVQAWAEPSCPRWHSQWHCHNVSVLQ